jgi:type I restriction enzyme M protein
LTACVLILRQEKPQATKDKVLFVNGESLFRKGRNQNTLEDGHAAALLESYQQFADQPGLAHVADLADIENKDFNLNIPLYVAPAETEDELTLEQALAQLEVAQQTAAHTRAALEVELAKWRLNK